MEKFVSVDTLNFGDFFLQRQTEPSEFSYEVSKWLVPSAKSVP